ncbi:MAG: deoxynucleoside kinase, partial [Chitinophagales bacterium]|nr:deoxynucleoside kinase [Chitinophagales bacterium]
MLYRHVVIEGNIGAGKTSLARRFASDLSATLLEEDFENNPFLPLYYQNPQRYAFLVELHFLAGRFHQLRNATVRPDLLRQALVCDYLFAKSALFASITLSGDELRLF